MGQNAGVQNCTIVGANLVSFKWIFLLQFLEV